MDRNPQAEQMAHESMIRNLAAQASCIWPQEERLFARYALPGRAHIADIGCGSGEITRRLAGLYPEARLVGVDILDRPLAHARAQNAALSDRVSFEQGDAFQLRFAAGEFDLVVCRHVTQAVPEPELVLAELWRVCKPGGWLHVLSEDFTMLHLPHGALDPDRLWRYGLGGLSRATGIDQRIGRKTWALMNKLDLEDVRVDYITVDTLRVPRETFAEIIRAWRDGYCQDIEDHGLLDPGEARLLFDHSIGAILDPNEYSVWHVPILSGRKPRSE